MAAKKKCKSSVKTLRKTLSPRQETKISQVLQQPLSTPKEQTTIEPHLVIPGPPVVGIGVSAGGLNALKNFMSAMPANSGIAFVLISHLDPQHDSMMVELLARRTKMSVIEATDGMNVEANHVYVIPPNKYMTIAQGVFKLTGPVERTSPQTSIDLFLRSLAQDKKEKAICIILSGAGSHGALGLKAVKASAGMAMVQDPSTAEYARMPQSAIASGLADFVLPVEKMPEELTKYVQQDSPRETPPPRTRKSGQETVVQQLEYELKATKEDLQSAIEELESSNEELKVSKKEVMSMNEELQSANEELETSKEELQSLNEELSTVNNQLLDKVAVLESANNEMANLLNCSDVAIIFLDNKLRIKRFTPPATRLFNLMATDLDRPISDITAKFSDSGLHLDIEKVMRTLVPRESQVQMQTPDGCSWNRRITPYRTIDNRIEGVVLTFTDVTQLRQAADKAQRLATVLLDSNDAVYVHDFDGNITTWNRGAERMLGYSETEALQMNALQMIPVELHAKVLAHWEMLRKGDRLDFWEAQRRHKNGRLVDVSVTATALRDQMGRPVAIAKIERDITETKKSRAYLEREINRRTADLRLTEEHLHTLLDTAADAIITIDAKGIIQSMNKAAEKMFGYAQGEMIRQNIKMLMPQPYRDEHDRYLADYSRTGVSKIIGIGREVVALRKDGSTFPVDLAVSAVDHLNLFTGIIRDITRRKELEREVLEIASLEQRRIGQDLHDSVGQELTALSIMAGDLAETITTDPSMGAKLAEKVAQGLRRSQVELRAVMRGLLPVSVDSNGLMASLSDLADRIQLEGKVNCTFVCVLNQFLSKTISLPLTCISLPRKQYIMRSNMLIPEILRLF